MIMLFECLPPMLPPVYEMGTALGVFLWDFGSRTWARTSLDDSAARKGYAPTMSAPMSEAAAKAELKAMEESVLLGLGMVIAWSQKETGFVSMAAGACELADLDYRGPPPWAR